MQLFRLPASVLDGNLCTVTSEKSVQQVVYDAEKAVLQKKKECWILLGETKFSVDPRQGR